MEDEDFLGLVLAVPIIIVVAVVLLKLSLWIFPPKHYDPTFTSRSLTGWTNTPKKLAWARTIEKTCEKKPQSYSE